MESKHSGRKKLLYSFFVLVAVLLAGEVVSRIWLHGFASPGLFRKYAAHWQLDPKDYQWSPHHYLNYYPTPNYSRSKLSHNSLGYRDREFDVKKPDGVFRIVAIGGSTTYTLGVNDNSKTFPALLEKLLREKYNYPNVEVINAGVSGYNTWESLINLQFRVLDLDPDMVMIYHGTNAVHARIVESDVYCGDGSGKRKQWVAPPLPWYDSVCLVRMFRRRFEYSHQVGLGQYINVDTYHGAHSPSYRDKQYYWIPELLAANPPIYFRRNMKNMIAIARANEIQVTLATWAYSPHKKCYAANKDYQQGYRETNVVLNEVAAAENVPIFDFGAVMPQDAKYWADGRHVNEMGVVLKSELFAAWLDEQGLIPCEGNNGE